MEISSLALALRTVLSLVAVFGLLALSARALRRFNTVGARSGTHRAIELIARQALGRNSAVAILRAGDKALVVGVTETQITLLSELDSDPFADADQQPADAVPGQPEPPSSFLDVLRERTVRRSNPVVRRR